MRRRRFSEAAAASTACCGCDCLLCGGGDVGRSELILRLAPPLRPQCILRCRAAPSCAFSTSGGAAEYERHLWSQHREVFMATGVHTSSVLSPDVFSSDVNIKVKEEEPEGESGKKALTTAADRKRGSKRKREEDLVPDDEEDEDYKWEDYYIPDAQEEEEEEAFYEKLDGSDEVFQCHECLFTADSADKIARHSEDHSGALMTCGYQDCNYSTDHFGNLSSHETTHLRWINKAFKDNIALAESLVTCARGGGGFGGWTCRACGHHESSKTGATLHASTAHHPDLIWLQDVSCRDCSFSCRHSKEMRDHVKKAHLCSSDRSPSHRLNRGRPRRKDEDGVKVGPGRKHVKKEEHREEGEEGEGGEKDDILCDLCGFATNTSLKLQRHMVAKHGDYQCDECPFSTPLHRKLVQHRKNVHREVCRDCGLPVADGESLHEGNHACPARLGEGRPGNDALDGVVRLRNTGQHIGALRDGAGYACLECGAAYKKMLTARRHVVLMHGRHVCPDCEFVGDSRLSLVHHLSKHHPLTCPRCCAQCESRQELHDHPCRDAPDPEADPEGLNPAKSRRNRLRLTACDIPGCSDVFADRRALRRHRKEAHGSEALVACHACAKYFANNSKLKLHVKTQHEGIRDLVCPFCVYATGDSGNFVKHVRKSHPGRRPDCPHEGCSFSAPNMSALSRHVVAQHQAKGRGGPPKRHAAQLAAAGGEAVAEETVASLYEFARNTAAKFQRQ